MRMNSGGLESLAIALIIAPDPVTTVVGLGLLAYSKLAGKIKGPVYSGGKVNRNEFSDLYTCKVYMRDKNILSYEVNTKRDGQLPPPAISGGKLISDSTAWRNYGRDAIKSDQDKKAVLTGQERPGLLCRPKVMNHTRLVEPVKTPRPRRTS